MLIVEGAGPDETPERSPEDGAACARRWMEEGLSASEAAKQGPLQRADCEKAIYTNC